MKRKRISALLLALLLLGSGCGFREDPYRVSTVVWIPVDPTQAAEATDSAQTSTESTEELRLTQTEAPAETPAAEAAVPTEPPETAPKPSESKPSSNKSNTSSKNNSSDKTEKPRETQPPATEAAAEPQMPATQPPETKPEKTLYDISGYSADGLGYGVADEINALRAEQGLASLTMSSRLSAIASCRAWELTQLWSHTRPDGRSFSTVLEDYGYGAGSVKELLVYVSGSGDAASLVAKWAGSDSHLQTILGAGFSTVGVGVYRTGGVTYVCVLLVG